MKIHLHVGPHKTGTTAVQSALWSERRRLLKTHGLLYPEACRYHYAQHRLAFAMKRMRDPSTGEVPVLQEEIAALSAEIARVRPERVILSSEEFFLVPPAAPKTLMKALTALGDVELIATVRHPLDAALSMHNQNVKGLATPYARAFVEVLNAPARIFKSLAFNSSLGRWEQAIEPAAVRVLQYERGDMLVQMSDALGLPAPLDAEFAVSNRSLHPKAAELVRLAKRAEMAPATRQRIAALAEQTFPADGSAPWLPEKKVAEFMSALKPEYNRLFKRHFDRENPYDLASAMDRIGPPENRLAPADLIDLLAARI